MNKITGNAIKFIEWCGLFSVGNDSIDSQHKMLVDIANQFHDHMGKAKNRKLVSETLSQLIHYAESHFKKEEAWAEEIKYPQDLLNTHKEIHEKLLEEIFIIHDNISKEGGLKGIFQTEMFIARWLILHILTEDKKYQNHLMKE
ncbi:MAG: bacteriohemerythrin [Proteobacteria bacterium]|nr:bacteriohemerythrin [Pseudomonadota bacterium]